MYLTFRRKAVIVVTPKRPSDPKTSVRHVRYIVIDLTSSLCTLGGVRPNLMFPASGFRVQLCLPLRQHETTRRIDTILEYLLIYRNM